MIRAVAPRSAQAQVKRLLCILLLRGCGLLACAGGRERALLLKKAPLTCKFFSFLPNGFGVLVFSKDITVYH